MILKIPGKWVRGEEKVKICETQSYLEIPTESRSESTPGHGTPLNAVMSPRVTQTWERGLERDKGRRRCHSNYLETKWSADGEWTNQRHLKWEKKRPKVSTHFLKEIQKTEIREKWPKIQPVRRGIKWASLKGQGSSGRLSLLCLYFVRCVCLKGGVPFLS